MYELHNFIVWQDLAEDVDVLEQGQYIGEDDLEELDTDSEEVEDV